MNKNILLVTADHWAGELFSFLGHPVIQTPTLDELAAMGTTFINAYSECPVCIPARRSLMTGTSPKKHNDRIFKTTQVMPPFPTLADCFKQDGYQAFASGKLHVYPQRDRIGFDDVMLVEEGRCQFGVVDDYELYLADEGKTGQQFSHGMSTNQYVCRPWHLEERLHRTSWITEQCERYISRRDPQKPLLMYLSYTAPHPPITPPASYLDFYCGLPVDKPYIGDWAEDPEKLPYPLKKGNKFGRRLTPELLDYSRRAFYASCTYIDHQLRRVIGTLRESGELENTVMLFTSDHGDMLGNHNLWAKRAFFESSARIPMTLVDFGRSGEVPAGKLDDRLVCMQDVMPTLLELSDIEVPDTVEGVSMISGRERKVVYGEHGEGAEATRMIRDRKHKLLYFPAGNRVLLFDMSRDSKELHDLSSDPKYGKVKEELLEILIENIYGDDLTWLTDGALTGVPEPAEDFIPKPGLDMQRGTHWPPPPYKMMDVEARN